MITAEILKECLFEIDGVLFWKQRPQKHFLSARAMRIFNAKYVGAVAGTLDSAGYRQLSVTIGGRLTNIRGHIVVYALRTGSMPSSGIDHINGNRSDNRIENLRLATQSQNLANTGIAISNKSGVRGVSWHKGANKWIANIVVMQKQIYLGLFDTLESAKIARVAASKRYFGEFARPIQ